MKWLWKILPWGVAALFATEIVVVMLPKREGEFHLREFGRLPVLLEGRVQPLDSVGRNALLQMRSTGDVPLEQVPSWKFWHHPKKLRSTEWLLETMARPELADTRPIFLIHHSELLGQLNLQDKGVEKSGLRYYTFDELRPVLGTVSDQARRAGEMKGDQQTSFHKQVTKLANALMLYQRLKLSLQPEGADHFDAVLADFEKNLGPAQKAAHDSQNGEGLDNEALKKVAGPLRQFQMMAQYAYPLIAPPLEPGKDGDWKNAGACLLDSFQTGQVHPAMKYFASMAAGYRHQRAADFNQAVAEYGQWLKPKFPRELAKGRAEFYYNDVKAFLHATIIYIAALVLAMGAVLSLTIAPAASESLRRSAFYLVIIAGIVHTFGLVFRMVLEGRPPVTNLYSSAVFIGWGTMIGGIILERIYRFGIGSIVASFVGFITLLIAHNLALGGDTMAMLRAVLDTNFWLATHVVVITLGYAATFAAGFLAILYIFLGLTTPLLTQKVAARPATEGSKPAAGQEVGKAMAKMVYGIVCFATLFSFLGTVLGGIWADQSWGRFWGWDPKENGALLIVLWNAIILHARWGGMIRERGLMNMAIFGNVVTGFSWFGVNMLEIGLHSYGFMDAASTWLHRFYFSQIAIILIGLLPLRYWRSFRTSQKQAPTARNASASPQPAAT